MRNTLEGSGTVLAAVLVAIVLAVTVGTFVAGVLSDVAAQLETVTVSDRLETVRCDQWGGRFADPCTTNR